MGRLAFERISSFQHRLSNTRNAVLQYMSIDIEYHTSPFIQWPVICSP